MIRRKSGIQLLPGAGAPLSGTKVNGSAMYNAIITANGKPCVVSAFTLRIDNGQGESPRYTNKPITGGVIAFERVIVDSKPTYIGRIPVNADYDVVIRSDATGTTYTYSYVTKSLEDDFAALEERVEALENA